MIMDTDFREPTTIGEMLTEEFLRPLGISQKQLAEALTLSRKTVNDICKNRRRLSVEEAVQLAELFELDADFWVNLQAAHDRWEAKQRHAKGVVLRPIMELLAAH
jgi:putative transposase